MGDGPIAAQQMTFEPPLELIPKGGMAEAAEPVMGQLAVLPLELREKIYGYVIGTPTVKFLYRYSSGPKLRMVLQGAEEKENLPDICYVNSQMHVEASLVFLRQATFNMLPGPGRGFAKYERAYNHWLCLIKYLKKFPERQGFEAVRSLHVCPRMAQKILLHGEVQGVEQFPGLKKLIIEIRESRFDIMEYWGIQFLDGFRGFENKFHLLQTLQSGKLPQVTLLSVKSRIPKGWGGYLKELERFDPVKRYLVRVKDEVQKCSGKVEIEVERKIE